MTSFLLFDAFLIRKQMTDKQNKESIFSLFLSQWTLFWQVRIQNGIKKHIISSVQITYLSKQLFRNWLFGAFKSTGEPSQL